MKNKKMSTRLVHDKYNLVPLGRHNYGVPILDGSTVLFDKYDDFISSGVSEQNVKLDKIKSTLNDYGRGGNSTTLAVEQIVAGFENADFCKLFSTGIAAIRTALIAFSSSGSHILVNDGIYTPVKNFIDNVLLNYGATCTYFDPMVTEDELVALVKPNTKVIYAEIPCSRFFEVANIDTILSVAKKIDAVTICDNSYSTWINFRPLDIGFDVSVTSLTKYAAGHSDMMSGSLCVKEKHFRRIFATVDAFGDHVSAQSSANLLRGMRTMDLRMEHSIRTGAAFIEYLKTKEIIKKIYHPSVKDHVGHENFVKYFTNAPSLMSVALDKQYSDEQMAKLFNSLELFGMGYSYGGGESLAIPLPPTNIRNLRQFSKNQPLPNSSMRLYIGLEDINDLIADFDNALDMLNR